MLFTGLTMLGYFSYKQLSVELYPNAELPYLFVMVGSPLEVDPRYMENQAIIPLEGAIGTLKDVEEIESSAGQTNGTIRISYRQNADIKLAYLKLLEKIDAVRQDIPEEFQVQVFKFDMDQINNMLMTIQVRGSGGVDRVRQITEEEIYRKIQNIDGVANVAIFGGREKSVEIYLDEDICEAHNITPGNVSSAISKNSRGRVFTGTVLENKRLSFVNVVAEYENISELENIVITQDPLLQLKDIATVFYGLKEQESYSRVNGKEAVTLQLSRDAQANIIDISHAVKEEIAELNEKLQRNDVEIVIQENQADTMERNIDLIINLALVGGILAIFVLWIFLRNIRLVAVIALVLPISVYTAFNFFYAFDISINSVTLLGMALAIGMLLDNSVVVLENIYRLAAKGASNEEAVVKGTKEVWRSIFAATLTTVMVFLPFAFSKNFMVGILGKHIGVSIISTLMVSLAVALLLVPMITYTFLNLKKGKVIFENLSLHNRLVQIYRVLLKSCMRYPANTILGAIIIFFVTLLISLGVSIVSNREAEVKELKMYFVLPAGSTLETTDLVVEQAEKKLEDLEEKKDVISQIYEEEAIITLVLKDNFQKIRQWSIAKLKQEVDNKVREVSGDFYWDPPPSSRRFGSGGFSDDGEFEDILGMGDNDEEIIIKGQDFPKMLDFAEDVRYYLNQQSGINRVDINVPSERPEVLLEFDKHIMALYNIPPSSVLTGLNTFPKTFSTNVNFKQGTDEYEIQIKTNSHYEERERNLKELKELPVQTANNTQLEMQNISSFTFDKGASSILRKNQEKELTIKYSFVDEVQDDKDLLEAARVDVDDLMLQIPYPQGIAAEVIHEDEQLIDFKFLIIAAILLIYMILASVFESMATPFVLMFSIPMAAIGSLLALIITGNSLLNANTLTGFVILLGIVVNNGILMIDYANILQKDGMRQQRALMLAGLARVRPILITAITTIIALIPLAMGKAEYVTEIGVPFAVTVIGGLALSTILTLVYVPTVYTGLHTSLKWIYQQVIWKKVVQLLILIVVTYIIYTEVDTTLWKIIDFILLIVLLPATFYFVETSLRQATSRIIPENDPLRITIRNLVKIYDRENRFMREWNSGIRIRKRKGYHKEYTSVKDLSIIIWQLPIIIFLVYFIYGHLRSGFWFFVLPALLQMIILTSLKPLLKLGRHIKASSNKRFFLFIAKVLWFVFRWIFPAVAMYLFYKRYQVLGLIIPFGILWYVILWVIHTSQKLNKNNTDINRLKGRFKKLRKGFYRMVLAIPLLGKQKKPFKALKGVSMNIENGMFGLLGPNGAGKSTLMRIICGILEPSYGQITINGFDIREKREELQGLIGYLPQEFGMYENMSAWDFLHYMGILKKIYNKEERDKRIKYVLEAVHMYDHRFEKIGSFSGGMKQRIGIAQILLHLPRILVVDEPTAGLDPRERIRFRNLLVELSRERIVIFSTHIIEDVASSCNKVAVVKKGKVQYLGEPVQMAKIADGKVWQLDLGKDEFEVFKEKYPIIHHMAQGEWIKARCIADEQPHKKAILVKANLEDAYLYLLTGK